ncbi:hypothetical protein SAMN05216436_1523 [bacterium A37T11]|nr:hypothetical protein SAMN05216436_1523 [bacterium A37T11]
MVKIIRLLSLIFLSSVSVSCYAQDMDKVESYLRDFQQKIFNREFFRNTEKLENDTATVYSFAIKMILHKYDSVRSQVFSVSSNDPIAHEFFGDLNEFYRFGFAPILGDRSTATLIIPFFIVYNYGPNRSSNSKNPMKRGDIDLKLLKLFNLKDYSSLESIDYIYLPPLIKFMRGK